MIADALRNFSRKTFSEKTLPVLHGETAKIQPLTLAVKKHRSVWKRPYAKLEMVILAELGKYVQRGDDNEVHAFHESLESKIKEEVFVMKQKIDEQKIDMEARAEELDHGVAGCLEGTIKLEDAQGVLNLGKLRQKYIENEDLRKILAETTLDASKMKNFDEHELLLITSVIYSEKFELKGKRIVKTDGRAEVENLSPFVKFLLPNLDQISHPSGTYTPPELATRTSEAAFLFKCCHVDFIKKNNRLEIRKGEHVRKISTKDECGEEDTEEEADDDQTFVDLHADEADLIDYLTKKDIENLDNICKKVLLPDKTTKRRKARVSKYLSWFEKALTTDQPKFKIDQPMTSDDSTFLTGIISVPYSEGSTLLDLSSLSEKEIHGYGIIFKVLNDLPDDQWKEIENPDMSNTKK